MMSLQTRVLLAAAALLLVFVILTSLALEQAFYDSARSARETRLLGQLYVLMGVAESEMGQLVLPRTLGEPRLSLPGSGLYAQVADAEGGVVWRSVSTLGLSIPFDEGLAPGEIRFEQRHNGSGQAYLVESFGVLWSTGPVSRAYTFSIAEDLAGLRQEVARFRASMTRGMGTMGALLLASLLILLRWGLRPLRRVATEVAAIEAGKAARLQGSYPNELRALTDNLNALLAHEHARQARLDNALGDLAHSLKTPLAVMRGAIAEGKVEQESATLMNEQISRMDEIVEYQLQRVRAGAPDGVTLAPPVPLLPLAQRLGTSLSKIHRDKGITPCFDLDEALLFRGVEGDLMELLGNLLDNAYKWCKTKVCVRGRQQGGRLLIEVEDDGPGISSQHARLLLERGVRADESAPGHGIGLSVVREICRAYGGDIAIERSRLGGALVRVRLGG
jgi:two-component system sensor histidine kinase PhoQ